AELAIGNGMVILSPPYDEFQVPGENAVHHQSLYVSVTNAHAHKANAISAGVTLKTDLRETDYGAIVYSARDFAGYHWIFAHSL
ncbi:MAG: hypothetical protein AAGI88_20875, partial [Pseudomonadota bacterium]